MTTNKVVKNFISKFSTTAQEMAKTFSGHFSDITAKCWSYNWEATGLTPSRVVNNCLRTAKSSLYITNTKGACTNVVQLWTRVKSEFGPSSAVNCVAPKQFKHWSPFNSELPSDHQSNFDLGSTRSYACALGNKYFLWYYCCKKLFDSNLILSKKTSSYRIIRLLMQLYWWSGYVWYSFSVLFVLDKLTNRWINCIFRWRCLAATVNIRSNPNHKN